MSEKFVYADHAATTAVTDTALAAMLPHFTRDYGNPSSLYRFAQEGKTHLEQARAQVAACLNARPEEIYFTSGGTEADNWALRGVAELMALKGKKTGHIITTAIEHHAILHTAQYLEKQGYEVTYLPVDGDGLVDPAAVEGAIRPDTILISVMAANNEIGTIQPIAEIGAIAKAHKVLFHTDAVQAVGHIPVDVEAWNVDLLSLSGHKFGGPKGIGALYMRKPLRLPALIQGGGQEKGRRSGTENVPGAAGMAAALKEAVDHLPEESTRLAALRDKLIAGLSKLPYTRLTGHPAKRLPGTASFVFEGVEGEALLLHLDAKGICASSGSACSSASLDPSHVLLSIGLPHAIAHGSLRLSLGSDNTEADVDYILKEVPAVVAYLREMSPVWDKDAQKPTWEL
ncbi:cysteine desulfurase NifS [uncultured Flavonifractor sp.]|uniref:Cysteine desulfurase IscS n=1 Tax=Candidatus Flavonifractor intestinigallinarum TaxID=2838586 RepID=A0A9D2MNM3_9FIRM|nr:cysteine desulfurase NifS [uncultured Flavonifractor sp.]HJB81219.1 cysteine desulfurase NifS [Candidatus Flavonifractor intestinigallinarum]